MVTLKNKFNIKVIKFNVVNLFFLLSLVFFVLTAFDCESEPYRVKLISSYKYCVKRDYDTGICNRTVTEETWEWSDGSWRTE